MLLALRIYFEFTEFMHEVEKNWLKISLFQLTDNTTKCLLGIKVLSIYNL